MQLEFYQQVSEALQHGAVAIATVIEIKGSVPREVGAKMMIERTGHTTGTIGGGAGEAKVIEAAIALLQKFQASQLNSSNSGDENILATSVTIDLTGALQRQTQGVCGGTMQIWIGCWLPTWGGAIAQALCQRLRQGKTTQLITPLSTTHPPDWQEPSDSNARFVEEFGDRSRSSDAHFSAATAEFLEFIRPNPTLLIVGGGHVGMALAEAATFAGFRVMVQDDRPELAEADRFHAISPDIEVLPGAIASVLNHFPDVDELYIALVTRGVTHDIAALECLFSTALTSLQQRIRYIGMMGSLKRVRHVFQCLEQKGLGGDRLNFIHAPIGAEIGALTPAEIAISICAELIQVRRSLC